MDHPLRSRLTIDDIVDNFEFLDSWEDRYGYLIELGRDLVPFPEDAMSDANKVRGCVSQVWLTSKLEDGKMMLNGMSDAHIVRGLVAIALTLFSGKTPEQIEKTDEQPIFDKLGLAEHLTPQRANGLRSMVARIKAEAMAAASG